MLKEIVKTIAGFVVSVVLGVVVGIVMILFGKLKDRIASKRRGVTPITEAQA